MKNKRIIIIIVLSLVAILAIAWFILNRNKDFLHIPSEPAVIYLYGEEHGKAEIIERELEFWKNFYDNENMRHLFLEVSYSQAQLLNIWMKEDNDEILLQVYDNLDGTLSHTPSWLYFYSTIKEQQPETLFHSTDVEHQPQTAEIYLEYLEEIGEKNSEEYERVLANIEQGKKYYTTRDERYREDVLVENFIREYDKIDGEKIMGIYGGKHVNPDESASNTGDDYDSMAKRLIDNYGDIIYCESVYR